MDCFYLQKATFGMATVKVDGSPSVKLLHDLQEKGLQFNTFIECLQTIGCQGALNELTAASKSVVELHVHVCAHTNGLNLICFTLHEIQQKTPIQQGIHGAEEGEPA